MVDRPARRGFLKGALWGTAAAMLSPHLRAAGMQAMAHGRGMPAAAMGGSKLCRHAVADADRPPPPLLDPQQLPAFVDPLPLPRRLAARAGQTLSIRMAASEQKLHRDLPPTRLWTYGGSFPGPTLEAHSGEPLTVEWINALPREHFLPIDHRICGAEADKPHVRAVVHLHGAKAPTAADGYPEDWYLPGQSRVHHYPNRQEAATLWYHDHAMGINRLNLYAGLLGMAWLRDAHELSLGLPEGEFELPLVLADRLITTQGQLYYPSSGVAGAPWVPEVFGNVTLVNGAILPRLDAQPRRYRLRVLNAANGRFFNLRLAGGAPFLQIGSDQGLLAAPVRQTRLLLAPGERVDLVVDLAGHRGQRVELLDGVLPLMQFNVGSGQLRDASTVPAVLRELPRMREAQATRRRELTIDEYADCVAEPMLMLLDGKRWHDPLSERIILGSTEAWSLVNLTEDSHPIHLHLVRFQILDRRPFDLDAYLQDRQLRYLGPAQPPPPGEAGWKDVVQVYPGMVTRIIATFDGYPGRYAWHCHLAEHEANEMMRPFEVVAA